MKKRRIAWKLVVGPNTSNGTLQMIIERIENPTKSKKYTGQTHGASSVPNPKKNDNLDEPTLEERSGL